MMVSFSRLALLSFQSANLRIPSISHSTLKKLGLPLALSYCIFQKTVPSKLTTCAMTTEHPGHPCTSTSNIETGYLNAKDAHALDQHLFSNGYTLEQLMELAGLAVAEAVFDCFPLKSTSSAVSSSEKRRLLVRRTSNFGSLRFVI